MTETMRGFVQKCTFWLWWLHCLWPGKSMNTPTTGLLPVRRALLESPSSSKGGKCFQEKTNVNLNMATGVRGTDLKSFSSNNNVNMIKNGRRAYLTGESSAAAPITTHSRHIRFSVPFLGVDSRVKSPSVLQWKPHVSKFTLSCPFVRTPSLTQKLTFVFPVWFSWKTGQLYTASAGALSQCHKQHGTLSVKWVIQ